jgi:hypothetical protein
MKKIFFVMAGLLLVLGFLVITSQFKSKFNESGQEANKIEKKESNNLIPKDLIKESKETKDYLEIGFELIRSESVDFLKDGLSSIEVIERLGNPEEKSDATEWGADGQIHQTWFYKSAGIELDMIQNKANSQVINMITITSPCKYRTKKGIGIGSKKDEVLTAYKNEINMDDCNEDSIVAGSIYGGIIFTIENQSVKSIFIGAAAE